MSVAVGVAGSVGAAGTVDAAGDVVVVVQLGKQ